MGLFNWGEKDRVAAAIRAAVTAMRPQIESARRCYSSTEAFEDRITSGATAAFIYGYVMFFFIRHRVRSPQLVWSGFVTALGDDFGPALAAKSVGALNGARRSGTSERWMEEGRNGARLWCDDHMSLPAAFLEGGAK